MAVASCVLLVAGMDVTDAWQARAQAFAVPPIKPIKAAPPGVDGADVRAVRVAIAQLDRPWEAAFSAIESVPVEGIAWLVLDVGERGVLRLEGQAPDAATALAAMAALRGRAPWREVLLEHLDQADAGPLRFALVASPADGAW
jgi:hypothetical protein